MGAIEDLRRDLEWAGLGDLAQGLWELHQQDYSDDAVYDWLLEQDAYKENFSGLITLREKGRAAGMTEAEYLQERQDMQSILIRAGLGDTQFTSREYLNNVLGNEVSLDEFENRVVMAQAAASTLPEPVREELRTRYGIDGSNVVAYYLDTETVEADLVNQQQAAILGASYSRYQARPISTEALEEVARQVDEANADQAIAGLGTLGGGLSEKERLLGAFGVGNSVALERRGRGARFQGGGSAATQVEGITGLSESSS